MTASPSASPRRGTIVGALEEAETEVEGKAAMEMAAEAEEEGGGEVEMEAHEEAATVTGVEAEAPGVEEGGSADLTKPEHPCGGPTVALSSPLGKATAATEAVATLAAMVTATAASLAPPSPSP